MFLLFRTAVCGFHVQGEEGKGVYNIKYLRAMRGLAATLIAVGAALVCGTSGLLFRIWTVRHSFDMAARSPVLLVCCSGACLTMAVLVLLHWFLLLEGRGLPCYATYWASNACELVGHMYNTEKEATRTCWR